jgi:hypothetical protein
MPPWPSRWTPPHLSTPFVSRITKVPVDTVLLDIAGATTPSKNGD